MALGFLKRMGTAAVGGGIAAGRGLASGSRALGAGPIGNGGRAKSASIKTGGLASILKKKKVVDKAPSSSVSPAPSDKFTNPDGSVEEPEEEMGANEKAGRAQNVFANVGSEKKRSAFGRMKDMVKSK